MADAVVINISNQPTVNSPSLFYQMRAFDSTLAVVVFWESATVDTLGGDYTGPGPIVDVVVQRQINKAV